MAIGKVPSSGRNSAHVGRKGVDAILTTILLVLLVISSVGGAWLFFGKMQGKFQGAGDSQADEQISRTGGALSIDSAYSKEVYVRNIGQGVLRNFDVYLNSEKIDILSRPEPISAGQAGILRVSIELKRGDWIRVVADRGTIAEYRVEKTKTSRCGNYRCEFPGDESCTTCPEDCGYCTDYISASVHPKNIELGSPMTVKLSMTASLVPESVVARITLPNRTTEEVPMSLSGGVWTARKQSDQNGVYLSVVRVKEKNGPFLPDFQAGTVSTSSWGDTAWRNRRPIFASEVAGFSRNKEYFRANYTGLVLPSGNCNEVKITDSFGELRARQVVSGGADWCEIISPLDATEGILEQVVGYIYYNNPSPPPIPYAGDVLDFNHASRCMENSKIKLCFGGAGEGGISFLSSDISGKEKNLLTSHTKESAYYRSGIQPQMNYKEGFDLLWCGNYTLSRPPVVRIGGPLYQVVDYSLSATCRGGRTYEFRTSVSFYSNKSFYDFSVVPEVDIETGKNGESVLFAPNWNTDELKLTSEGASCDDQSCYHWTDIISSPLQLGIGAVLLEGSQHVVFGSIAPPHSVAIPEETTIFAGENIYSARAFISERDNIFFEMNSLKSEAKSPLHAYFFLGEEEEYSTRD